MLEDDVSKCPLEETLRRRFREKVQTYVSCPASPGSLSMGLNCLFFFVLAGPHDYPLSIFTYLLHVSVSLSLAL